MAAGVRGGADTTANTRGGGALEVDDLRLPEKGSERGGAISDAVPLEAASEGRSSGIYGGRASVSTGADTERRTVGRRFEGQAAYLRDRSVVLPLRPSAIAAPPFGPSWLY